MKYEQLMTSLEYAPTMNTFVVKLANGDISEAETFKAVGNTEDEVKEELASKITAFIDGKQPVVRIMPEILLDEDGRYKGRARIAAIPLANVNVTMNQSELQAEFNRIKDNVTYTINADIWKDKFKV